MFGSRYLYCGIESVSEVMPRILEAKLGIELVFDDTTNLWPQLKWENLLQIGDEIQATGVEAAVHGPFHGINLGSRDSNIRRISSQMLMSGLDFARAVRSPHLVMHSGFVPQYSPKARAKWMDEFCATVEPLLNRASELEVRVALENTYEWDTSLFEEIFERVQNPALGMCLDTGHATCFGKVEPAEWSRRFAERISHIHCSDNDGRDDLHWGLGKGVVNFEKLLRPLRQIGSFATVTFEVDPEDALAASEYFDQMTASM